MKWIYFSLLLIGCKTPDTEKFKDVCFLSDTIISEKVAFKDLYRVNNWQGKRIELPGILHYNFEDIALYEDKSSENAIWLSFAPEVSKYKNLLLKLNGKKVFLIGTLDTLRKGHLSSYFATLENVSCVKIK